MSSWASDLESLKVSFLYPSHKPVHFCPRLHVARLELARFHNLYQKLIHVGEYGPRKYLSCRVEKTHTEKMLTFDPDPSFAWGNVVLGERPRKSESLIPLVFFLKPVYCAGAVARSKLDGASKRRVFRIPHLQHAVEESHLEGVGRVLRRKGHAVFEVALRAQHILLEKFVRHNVRAPHPDMRVALIQRAHAQPNLRIGRGHGNLISSRDHHFFFRWQFPQKLKHSLVFFSDEKKESISPDSSLFF